MAPIRKTSVRRGPTLLVVEDQVDVRDALVTYLGDEGFRVIAVANGTEALVALSGIQVDVILADYQLPDMLGTEVLELASTHYRLPRGAAVIVSGVEPLRGDFAFLQKPCELDELTRALWDRASIGRYQRKRAQWS